MIIPSYRLGQHSSKFLHKHQLRSPSHFFEQHITSAVEALLFETKELISPLEYGSEGVLSAVDRLFDVTMSGVSSQQSFTLPVQVCRKFYAYPG